MAELSDTHASPYSVPPVERAFSLLRHIANGNRCQNLAKTSKALNINRTTLIRLIHTLLANRMIEEIDEDSGYRLGSGLVSLAAQAMHSRDIVQLAKPIMTELANRLKLSTHLGILDGTDIVYLSRETPNTHLVSNVRAGSRLPAHATTVGRAILSAMPEEEVHALYADNAMGAVTDKTATSVDALLDQLREDRQKEHAWSVGNFESGIGSCAAVVYEHRGKPAAAINVSGPESRFDDDGQGADEIRQGVIQAAHAISVAMGYHDSGK